MLDVFISYSRRNLEFVQRLADGLEQQGKQVWFDRKKEALQGIPAGSKWWDEIKHGIETADNFLLVISPHSLASPYCHAEIAYALSHEKRMITLLYCANQTQTQTFTAVNDAIDLIDPEMQLPQSVSADQVNLRSLARRNWYQISQIQFVSYVDDPEWNQWLKQVIEALDLDIQWIRTWSQFRQSVQMWVESDYSADYLLPETRLKPIREMAEKRGQVLSEDEAEFIQPEQGRLYHELGDINTTTQRRFDIGERLALIGDTRKGVGVVSVEGTNGKFNVPDIEWLSIQEGGELDIDGRTFIVEPLYIAKYLITTAQFRAFNDNGNAARDEWWEGMPFEDARQYYDTARHQNSPSNAPCDQISWYAAVAYARWLDNLLQQLDLKPDPSLQIRLPTEWEWQWVAQNGVEACKYPWGAYFERNYANTREAGLNNRPTAVGMFPHGKAQCGALDMAGNLLEWCLNKATKPDDFLIEKRKPIYPMMLRGGSFYSHGGRASNLYRKSTHFPGHYTKYFGFRLVCAPRIELK